MKDIKFELHPGELAQIIQNEREGKNLLPLWRTKEEEEEVVRAFEQEQEQERKDWENQQEKSKQEREQFVKQHPNYCKACDGWGETHEPGGWINPPLDGDCETCLFYGKCPYCGSTLELCEESEEETDNAETLPNPYPLVEGGNGYYVGRCSCGWEYGAEGLPPIY